MITFLFAIAIATALPALEQQAVEAFYTVSYVEVKTASRDTAVTAFLDYEATSSAADGNVRFELFEEPDQSGRFAIVETWRNEAAFEAAGTATRQALTDALGPIRLSDYDQRPYKVLAVGPAPESSRSPLLYVVAHVDVSRDPELPELLGRHAEQSRLDEGNIRFDVLQHTMRANHFTVIEAWQNLEAYRLHVEADHTRQYRDALGPFLGSPIDQRLYRPLD